MKNIRLITTISNHFMYSNNSYLAILQLLSTQKKAAGFRSFFVR